MDWGTDPKETGRRPPPLSPSTQLRFAWGGVGATLRAVRRRAAGGGPISLPPTESAASRSEHFLGIAEAW